MQKLLEPNTVPPDGFCYLQAETKTWIRAPDYQNLFEFVRDHRKANNLPLGTFWEAEVEDQLCQRLPPGQCKESIPGRGRNVFTRIPWHEAIAGTQTLASWLVQGLPKVSQELADSRGNVCSRCYYNVAESGGCHACGQLQKLATTLIGSRTTSAGPFLKVCAVCKCSLQVKVWVGIDVVEKGMTKELYDKYPDFCWQKKEVDQYRKAKS